MLDEGIEGLWVMTPYHEDVINEPIPYQWLEVISVDMSVFKITHCEICYGGGTFGAHGYLLGLQEVFSIELKIVTGEYKRE